MDKNSFKELLWRFGPDLAILGLSGIGAIYLYNYLQRSSLWSPGASKNNTNDLLARLDVRILLQLLNDIFKETTRKNKGSTE